jgi:hypothetical protein
MPDIWTLRRLKRRNERGVEVQRVKAANNLSAEFIALTLRRIATEKVAHMQKWRKTRPPHWIDMYENDIAVLNKAAVGYENLARKNAEGKSP